MQNGIRLNVRRDREGESGGGGGDGPERNSRVDHLLQEYQHPPLVMSAGVLA